jgi:hypothetical protein
MSCVVPKGRNLAVILRVLDLRSDESQAPWLFTGHTGSKALVLGLVCCVPVWHLKRLEACRYPARGMPLWNYSHRSILIVAAKRITLWPCNASSLLESVHVVECQGRHWLDCVIPCANYEEARL